MARLLKLRVVPHCHGLGVAVRGRGGPDGGGEEVKGASAMRQPLDCGGSTPLWLRGREDLAQRQQRRPEGTESEADRPANDANEKMGSGFRFRAEGYTPPSSLLLLIPGLCPGTGYLRGFHPP